MIINLLSNICLAGQKISQHVKAREQLPDNAKAYVAYLEKQLDHEIQFVSVGAKREQYIVKRRMGMRHLIDPLDFTDR